jgi:FADH2 O2-dependent halogenase
MAKVDVLVIGSGFSGSLLAWILAAQGRRVMVIDRQRHPRFAIGESSTPTADFLLAHLSERWNLKELSPMACWGTWKERYPEVQCGKKRGFSYYRHHPNTPYQDDLQHRQSLLVAASASDQWSDTHWLRSSVDGFFAQRAQAAGVQLIESCSVAAANYDPIERVWRVGLRTTDATSENEIRVESPWIVDASGAGNALAPFVGNVESNAGMRTRTRAIFGHFQGVAPFVASRSPDDPFCGDDAAQHHVLDKGWCWMLRMDNGITSVGLVEPNASAIDSPQDYFRSQVDRYPSLASMLAGAERTAPETSMGYVSRLSRCRARAVGPGWVSMPVTYGFVDPLHSSGIAHALSGVARIADAMLSDPTRCREQLVQYAEDLRREVDWIDTLVAGCYAAQPAFDSFVAFASFYFIAAIEFEKQLAADPSRWPRGFLQSQDAPFRAVVDESYAWLIANSASGPSEDGRFFERVQRSIGPWNRVGLLEPSTRNRIAHSVAPKYASIATSFRE